MGATNAYITGDVDPGLLVVTANLLPETSVAEAEQALWEELRELATNAPSDYELTKIKNKFEAEMTYGEMNIMNKAMNLGYYSMLGDLPLINREAELFRSITRSEICAAAAEMFRPERSSTLIYAKK
jgi:predicted Zn-dependent peptidase